MVLQWYKEKLPEDEEKYEGNKNNFEGAYLKDSWTQFRSNLV